MLRWSLLNGLLALLVLLNVTGCGDSGPSTVRGVAAAGAPIVGTVYLKDSATPPQERSAVIAADGSFRFDLGDLTPPFLLKAVGTVNGTDVTLYSFAGEAGVANINPLAHLAVALANGSDDLAGLYAVADPAAVQAVKRALPGAIADVRAVLQPTLTKFGVANVDFMAAPFVANHQGLDLFLDLAGVSSANGIVTVVDKPANTVVARPLNEFAAGSIDIIATPPGATGSVIVWPAFQRVATTSSARFTAVVVGSPNQQVTWTVTEENGGTITDEGVYTAPATAGTYHLIATSVADATHSATVPITVREPNTLRITQTAPGVFAVQAIKLINVAAMDITLLYDPASMANPTVTAGPLASSAVKAVNADLSGRVRWAMVTTQPLSGAGTLFTLNFDVLDTTAGRISSASARLFDSVGQPMELVMYLPLPEIPPPAPPVAAPTPGNEVPAGSGTPIPAISTPPPPPAESAVPYP